MAHKVKCYYCQQIFDRDKEPFVQVNGRRYAHKLCAEKAETHVEEVLDDKGKLEQYIMHLFGDTYVSPRIRKQINDYVSTYNFTYSGILKALTYFYETESLTTRKYTYMDTGSLYGGVDGALLAVNYKKSVKVKIGGLSAWIPENTYEIVPITWVKSSSSYTVTDSIKHNYVSKIQNTYNGSKGSVIGPKPEQLSEGTYYSYDGHYFYKDLKTMIKDYKNGNYNNSVNKNNPYYNYYMYLSNHSKTTYSSLNIDEYIRNNMGISKNVYGDVSKEICGGPHVKHTGELGKFVIKKEEASSAGVRRIKAILE